MKRKLFVCLVSMVVIVTIFSLSGCTSFVPGHELGVTLDYTKKIIRIEVINTVVPIDHTIRYIEHTDKYFSNAMDIVQRMVEKMQLKKKIRIVANKAFIINVIYDDNTKLSLVGLSEGKLYEEVLWFKINDNWYKSNLLKYDYLYPLIECLHTYEQVE